MISQTVEYTLRAVVMIAQHDGSEPCTAKVLAKETQAPLAYLSKLLQNLARADIVKSRRGVHGGFILNRNPRDLTVLDIVNVVEPLKRITTCPLGIVEHQTSLCPLHKTLDGALELVEESFRKTTIEDLLNFPGHFIPLCEPIKPYEDGTTNAENN